MSPRVRRRTFLHLCLVAVVVVAIAPGVALAQSTIDPGQAFAYSGNGGWIDARPDDTSGVLVSETFLAGYAYAANFGWIHLGDGSPANSHTHANSDGSDCGVNRFARYNGSTWALTTVDGATSARAWPSLTFGPDREPAISFYNNATSTLCYAHFSGTGWIVNVIDANPTPQGVPTSLAFGRDGQPAVASIKSSGLVIARRYLPTP